MRADGFTMNICVNRCWFERLPRWLAMLIVEILASGYLSSCR